MRSVKTRHADSLRPQSVPGDAENQAVGGQAGHGHDRTGRPAVSQVGHSGDARAIRVRIARTVLSGIVGSPCRGGPFSIWVETCSPALGRRERSGKAGQRRRRAERALE